MTGTQGFSYSEVIGQMKPRQNIMRSVCEGRLDKGGIRGKDACEVDKQSEQVLERESWKLQN